MRESRRGIRLTTVPSGCQFEGFKLAILRHLTGGEVS